MNKLVNSTKNQIVCEQVIEARGLFMRLQGLIGRPQIANSECMWFNNCSSIHTCFMSFAIDVIFVDKNIKVKALYSNVKPWRLVGPVWGAQSVFEMKSGLIKDSELKVGDQLNVVAANT